MQTPASQGEALEVHWTFDVVLGFRVFWDVGFASPYFVGQRIRGCISQADVRSAVVGLLEAWGGRSFGFGICSYRGLNNYIYSSFGGLLIIIIIVQRAPKPYSNYEGAYIRRSRALGI